jgi:hypothetical protein
MITSRTIPNWTGHLAHGLGAATPTIPDWTGLPAGASGGESLVVRLDQRDFQRVTQALRAMAATIPDWTGLLGEGTPTLARTIPDWTGLPAEADGLFAPARVLVGVGRRTFKRLTKELELDSAA